MTALNSTTNADERFATPFVKCILVRYCKYCKPVMTDKFNIATEAVKTGPPAVVAGASVAGIDIPQVIQIATLVYLAMQIGLLLPSYYRALSKWLSKKDSRPPE